MWVWGRCSVKDLTVVKPRPVPQPRGKLGRWEGEEGSGEGRVLLEIKTPNNPPPPHWPFSSNVSKLADKGQKKPTVQQSHLSFLSSSSPHPLSAQLSLCGPRPFSFPEVLEKPHFIQSYISPWEGVHSHLVIHSFVGTDTCFGLWVLPLLRWGTWRREDFIPSKAQGFPIWQGLYLPCQTRSSLRTERGGGIRLVSAFTCLQEAWLQFSLSFLHTPLDEISQHSTREKAKKYKAQYSPHTEDTASNLQVIWRHLDLCQGGHSGTGEPANLWSALSSCSYLAMPLAVLVGLVCRVPTPEVGGSQLLPFPALSLPNTGAQYQMSIINWSTQ